MKSNNIETTVLTVFLVLTFMMVIKVLNDLGESHENIQNAVKHFQGVK